jgi:hypothetical protein
VSLTPRLPILAIFESIFSVNTKPYAKRLQPVNQDPRWGIVWWKNRGSQISWHCPFLSILLCCYLCWNDVALLEVSAHAQFVLSWAAAQLTTRQIHARQGQHAVKSGVRINLTEYQPLHSDYPPLKYQAKFRQLNPGDESLYSEQLNFNFCAFWHKIIIRYRSGTLELTPKIISRSIPVPKEQLGKSWTNIFQIRNTQTDAKVSYGNNMKNRSRWHIDLPSICVVEPPLPDQQPHHQSLRCTWKHVLLPVWSAMITPIHK